MTEQDILRQYKTIAVVGLSSDTSRVAWSVSHDMQAFGFRIIPVHPEATEVLGEKVYPNLQAIPEPVEIVNMFRRSEHVPPFVEDAIEIGAKVVWMQQGIVNEEAAERARAAGLEVVQDSCIRTVYQRMMR